MANHQLSGLFLFGTCRDFSKVCYLSNYIPRHSWALLFIPQEGSPTLWARVAGTRDLPFVRTLTWIEDIRPAGKTAHEVGETINSIMANGAEGVELCFGICGAKEMPYLLYDGCFSGQGYTLKPMDETMDKMMVKKRPREIRMLKDAAEIVKLAINGLKEAYQAGEKSVKCLLESERIARMHGATDVRLLVSLDQGKTLQPLDQIIDHDLEPLVAYLSVQYLGYWADACVTLMDPSKPIYAKGKEVLEYLIHSLRPGVMINSLVHEVTKLVTPFQMHPVLQGSVGNSIGLSPLGFPRLSYDDGLQCIEEGSVFTIRTGLTHGNNDYVLLSAIVHIKRENNDILFMSC
jgi:Xaa-Pro aminopeptidase